MNITREELFEAHKQAVLDSNSSLENPFSPADGAAMEFIESFQRIYEGVNMKEVGLES